MCLFCAILFTDGISHKHTEKYMKKIAFTNTMYVTNVVGLTKFQYTYTKEIGQWKSEVGMNRVRGSR